MKIEQMLNNESFQYNTKHNIVDAFNLDSLTLIEFTQFQIQCDSS